MLIDKWPAYPIYLMVNIGKGGSGRCGSCRQQISFPGAIVVGNPAKPIVETRAEDLNYNPCEFLAANQAWLRG